MRDLAERAIAACRDYDRWASEVSRLTEAIRETECPHEAPAEQETHFRGYPSCFKEAAQKEVPEILSRPEHGLRRLTLDEIEREVKDCPACSRLVQLIRDRRHARRMFGAAKRRVRALGKRAAAGDGDAPPERQGKEA